MISLFGHKGRVSELFFRTNIATIKSFKGDSSDLSNPKKHKYMTTIPVGEHAGAPAPTG